MKRLVLAALLFSLACPVWAQSSFPSRSREPAINQWWVPAHRGDAEAQYNLGLLHGSGTGIAQNLAEAAKWYRRAAEQGHDKAQAMLGVLYSSGQGVVQSHTEAIKWWRRAADQGNADARFNLGMAYWKGEGVAQDFDKATALFKSMAPAGSSYARSVLGTKSTPPGPGATLPQTKTIAKPLEQPPTLPLPLVARQQNQLQDGMTEPPKPVPAETKFTRYLSAAERGDANAQSQVGYMYAVGLGVARNLVEAHRWTNIAAARLPAGKMRDSSVSNRNAAAAQMSPEQILKAQRLARDWLMAFDRQRKK